MKAYLVQRWCLVLEKTQLSNSQYLAAVVIALLTLSVAMAEPIEIRSEGPSVPGQPVPAELLFQSAPGQQLVWDIDGTQVTLSGLEFESRESYEWGGAGQEEWFVDVIGNFDYAMELSIGDVSETLTGDGFFQVCGLGTRENGETYGLEMMMFEINTELGGTSVMLRESYSDASKGWALNNETGFESSYVLELELSLDGGVTWHSPILVPEPTATSVLWMFGLALGCSRRRRM